MIDIQPGTPTAGGAQRAVTDSVIHWISVCQHLRFPIPKNLFFILIEDTQKKENLAVIIISYARAGARVRGTRFVKKIFLNQGFREIWS